MPNRIARVGTWVTLLAALAAYGWWATSLERFTWPARLAFGLPGAVVLGAALAHRPRRLSLSQAVARGRDWLSAQTSSPGSRLFGAAVWLAMIAVVVAWELFSFVSAEHQRLPTISHFIFDVTDPRGGRTAAFVAWIGLGWYAVRR